MRSAKRQPAGKGTSVLPTTKVAVPVFAAFFSLGFCTPSFSATAGTTAWADSVRAHLGLTAAPMTSASPAKTTPALAPARAVTTASPSAAPAHPVTVWARSVEAHLADRAHRVAEAGREAIAWSESGMASWYGGRFAGHRTSSGAVYNPMQLTCAHPSLPLGTKVLVTSETTGRSVVVTVNDRGPFSGRIVDLSREAAARIGILGAGTGSVMLEKATPEAIEVAEAQDQDTSAQAIAAAEPVSPSLHGRRHTHHADR